MLRKLFDGPLSVPYNFYMKLMLKLFLSLIIFAAQANIAALYNLQDLEILEKEKNYIEFLKHARDIRPIDRNKHWKEMLHNMAAGMINHYLEKKRINKKNYEQVEALMDWPTLKKDEVFVSKRNQFAMVYLDHCFQSQSKTPSCLTALDEFWNNSDESQAKEDIGIQLAELLSKHNVEKPLWPYISQTIKGQLSQMMCRRPLVQKIIMQQMIKVVELKQKEIDREMAFEKLASDQCWHEITPQLKKVLYESPRRAQEAFYTLLKLRESINMNEESLFLTRFILDGPYNGPVFNRAWNKLKKLGASYKNRRPILKQLEAIDPLPDQLFEYSVLKRNKIIIDHISQNMPEYLDHYARTCISYYKGSKTFPMGNPTVYCRNLFKAIGKHPGGKLWIDSALFSEFDELKL